jgi:NTE family protein
VIPPERTAVVLAGGGERVVAWEVGVLAGLADRGFDARGARVLLGTSAGAFVAARAALRDLRSAADALVTHLAAVPARLESPSGAAEQFERFAELWLAAGGGAAARRTVARLALEWSPGGEPEFVAGIALGLRDATWPRAVRVVATDAVTGDRTVVRADSGVPLATAVAASRAVPLRCPPVGLGGRPHVDGALGSATNADLLLGDVKDGEVAHVLVVDPGGRDTMLDRIWGAALEDEVAVLTDAGAAVTLVRAGHSDLAAMGPDPMSGAMAALAVTAGRTAGALATASRATGTRLTPLR